MNTELQPLMNQVEQVRRRLMIAGGSWLAAFVVCYSQAEFLFKWLVRPVRAQLPEKSHLAFLNATEPFFTFLKISAVAALIVALPVILWQIWALIAPLLKLERKIFAVSFVLVSYSSFLLCAYFGFVYVFPLIVSVLIHFGTDTGTVNAMISIDSYLSLATTMLIAFGLVSELPLAMVLLARMGIVDHRMLRQSRKYMIIVGFVFAAVITPGPDVISQCSIAIPFVILYEIGIIGARLYGRKRSPTADTEENGSES